MLAGLERGRRKRNKYENSRQKRGKGDVRDNTPDDGSSAEHSGARADESVAGLRRAHAVDVAEHPSLDTELGGKSDTGSDDLSPEHGTGRDLHVVAKLEVGGEGKALGHGDVAPGLEHHHGDGSARKGVTDDEFGDDVETDLLAGEGENAISKNRKGRGKVKGTYLVMAWIIPIGTM